MARKKSREPSKSSGPDRGAALPWPTVVVVFKDEARKTYADGIEREFRGRDRELWQEILKTRPGLTLHRLFTALIPKQHAELVSRAGESDPDFKPLNFRCFYQMSVPESEDPATLAKELQQLPSVETTYVAPVPSEPTPPPAQNPLFASQGYLCAAPDGIGATDVWDLPGGRGQGVRFIDIERGWTLGHEDLQSRGAQLICGAIRPGSRGHGTSVLGIVGMIDNGVGGIGAAPDLGSIQVMSYYAGVAGNGAEVHWPIADVISLATWYLGFGDVLLLEAQFNVGAWAGMPVETTPAEFAMIRLATALGIMVVEAAGNGNHDLDTYLENGQPVLSRNQRDSGAILVGAGTSSIPHGRIPTSNYGSRVDCYAWGEAVATCDSDVQGQSLYRSDFGGTSSAAAVIAGAAIVAQGLAAQKKTRLWPRDLRRLLSETGSGTLSKNHPGDKIGVMPDLSQMLRHL
jgi:serine protease